MVSNQRKTDQMSDTPVGGRRIQFCQAGIGRGYKRRNPLNLSERKDRTAKREKLKRK
jgi:hypothetical protein